MVNQEQTDEAIKTFHRVFMELLILMALFLVLLVTVVVVAW